MNGCFRILRRKSFLHTAIVWTLIAIVPAAYANPKWFPQFQRNPERHAQKIHHKLAKYKPHTYLHLVLQDNSQENGTVAALSEKSFTFINADSNAVESHLYKDVSKVHKSKIYIGQGTAPRRHIHLF
jgi:hypothetical protein